MADKFSQSAGDLIRYISEAEKKTPVKLFVSEKEPVDYGRGAQVFGGLESGGFKIVFGDWKDLAPIIAANKNKFFDLVIENCCCNSAIPLLDIKDISARIEPGAIIRDNVEIGHNAVIMMGAIINIGAVIGDETMIDMGAVLGGRAVVGRCCHIGAGAVLAGVIEPISALPVVVEDNVLIGANAVLLEGVHVGRGAVVAAGAVVIEDVPANAVVAGCPAGIVKMKDFGTCIKTSISEALREL